MKRKKRMRINYSKSDKRGDVEKQLAALAELIDRSLLKYVSEKKEYPPVIYRAMKYSVFAGGKRLRPAMLLLSAKACGLSFTDAMPAACAVEMIHTYSLIHDDLPAMDDDDMRRGKPTSHRKFGEAVAILAGDALLNRAFETFFRCRFNKRLDSENILASAAFLACASGVNGMIGGQVLDIKSENKRISRGALSMLHEKKTGALIKASVVCGAMLAGAEPADLKNFSVYGEKAGLAFQITDDILDVTGDEKKMGKKVHKDAAAFKSTYPAVYGLERSAAMARELTAGACAAIGRTGLKTRTLSDIAVFITGRNR
jgi:geranylgeranyl diphosphate synthase type II